MKHLFIKHLTLFFLSASLVVMVKTPNSMADPVEKTLWFKDRQYPVPAQGKHNDFQKEAADIVCQKHLFDEAVYFSVAESHFTSIRCKGDSTKVNSKNIDLLTRNNELNNVKDALTAKSDLESKLGEVGHVDCSVSSNPNVWDSKKWTERNSRPVEPLLKKQLKFNLKPYPKSGSLNIKNRSTMIGYYSTEPNSGHYVLAYDDSTNSLKFLESYRISTEPAFRIQQAMLQELSKVGEHTLSIRTLIRNSITNEETKHALKKDFHDVKSGSTMNGNFMEMNFFQTVNGRNSLDFIKAISPTHNPFDLIEKVEFQYKQEADGWEVMNVLIYLKEPILVK